MMHQCTLHSITLSMLGTPSQKHKPILFYFTVSYKHTQGPFFVRMRLLRISLPDAAVGLLPPHNGAARSLLSDESGRAGVGRGCEDGCKHHATKRRAAKAKRSAGKSLAPVRQTQKMHAANTNVADIIYKKCQTIVASMAVAIEQVVVLPHLLLDALRSRTLAN